VDARGSTVISTNAGFLTIALVDANDFIIVITQTRSFHHEQEQGHKIDIATAYAGAPLHLLTSLLKSTPDEASSHYLQ
jgi:hypothetical protein